MDLMNLESADTLVRRIFILEDETDISALVALNLNRAGFFTKEFPNAELFFKQLKFETPDLVILDLMLPDIDGLEVCRFLRKDERYASIPIIMLTAKAEEIDKIIGLEIGSDDYITKPFSPRELVARVKAVLRRDPKIVAQSEIQTHGVLSVDFAKYQVFVNGDKTELTTTEFKLLRYLLSKPGWVFSRGKILEQLDPNFKGVLDRTVDVHIKNLREKLGSAGKYIKNVRGIGYKFELN